MKRLSLLSRRAGLVAVGATWLVVHTARAHTLPISTLTLVPDESYLHLELTLNPFELTFFGELDGNRDGRLDPGEWTGHGENIAWRLLEALKLRVNNRPVTADIAGLSQSYESHHIAVRAHFAVDARRARVSLESQLAALTSGSHITQVNLGTGRLTTDVFSWPTNEMLTQRLHGQTWRWRRRCSLKAAFPVVGSRRTHWKHNRRLTLVALVPITASAQWQDDLTVQRLNDLTNHNYGNSRRLQGA